jgi:DNA-binding transcriptional MocR family regulator
MVKQFHVTSWAPALKGREGPVYLAIADAIAGDIADGRLRPGARLPAQRALADVLDIDFTTVTRAYAEAGKRGLVEGRVGHGTYVRLKQKQPVPAPGRPVDVSMNLPPRFEDAALEARMKGGIDAVAGEGLDLLLTYQDPAGAPSDRLAGAQWLAPRLPELSADRIVVCPGTQGAMVAALSLLAQRGDTVCAENLTYPGFLALTAHLGIQIIPVAMDAEGLLPDHFEAVCKSNKPKALYCTPTLHNPTTATIPLARRKQIVGIARHHGVRIIEDDAYGALPREPVPPLASLAPDCVYHIAGLSKCLSPALRTAYLALPDSRVAARAANAVRAFCGMASPLTAAIATRWIEDGTAGSILGAIRKETAERQAIAARVLRGTVTKPNCFHAWLQLPEDWNAGTLASRARLEGVGLVTGDAFAVGKAPEAVRIGLGSPRTAADLSRGLEIVADLLARPPASSSNII